MNEIDLMTVLPLIRERMQQGCGTFLQVASSAEVQKLLAEASLARAGAAYSAYLDALQQAQAGPNPA